MTASPRELLEREISGARSGVRVYTAAPPSRPAPFRDVNELLEAAWRMFQARMLIAENPEETELADAVALARYWTRYWHQSLKCTGEDVPLCRCLHRNRLNAIEREIVALLVLDRLAMLPGSQYTCAELLEFLNLPGADVIRALRAMSEEGRLYRLQLITYDDEDEDIRDRRLIVDPGLVDGVLCTAGGTRNRWPVKSERELYERMSGLSALLQRKAESLEHVLRGLPRSDFFKLACKTEWQLRGLKAALALHPDWGLYRLLEQLRPGTRRKATCMLIALVGKELGHVDADDELFQGAGLARAACDCPADLAGRLSLLRPQGQLVRDGFIQPCAGSDVLLSDDPRALEEVEFELTEKSVELLGLDRRLVKKREDHAMVREARVSLDQLVLSDRVRRALTMAAAQARHSQVLIRKWGLGDVIAYGRGVTLLFSGPPGVGKTACAEALAHELRKPILVADYAQIQNCFVGNTEKNIARAFRQARKHEAVLFWDEADAMFCSRDGSLHSWEVRDVNVLLQELERFEGVCVLATNRKISLDAALERRITLKVEFERPDRNMRRQIWGGLLPKTIPLAKDVDLDRLSCADLCGGEIKNVVLNAARLALARNSRGRVTMSDFEEAVGMETRSRWSAAGQERIGFGR